MRVSKLNIAQLPQKTADFFQKAPEILVMFMAGLAFSIGWIYRFYIIWIINFTDYLESEFLSVCLGSITLHSLIILIYDFIKKDVLEKLRSKRGQEILRKIPFRILIGFICWVIYDPAVCTLVYRNDPNFSSFRKLKTVLIFILSTILHSAFWLYVVKHTAHHFFKK